MTLCATWRRAFHVEHVGPVRHSRWHEAVSSVSIVMTLEEDGHTFLLHSKGYPVRYCHYYYTSHTVITIL